MFFMNRFVFVLSLLLDCSDSFQMNDYLVPSTRLVGAIINSKSMIGPKMCMEECMRRKSDCLSVNYNHEILTCELNNLNEDSVDVDTEENWEYAFFSVTEIYSNTEANERSQCSTVNCGEGRICSVLKSGKTECVNVRKPVDCADLYDGGAMTDGVYIIYPTPFPIRAYCYMTVDGGGWTAFQRRFDGSVDFYQGWNEYRNGFGHISKEHWLGNENLYNILSNGDSEFRADMKSFDDESKYVKFSTFYLGDETSKYTVTFLGFSGNTGDSFTDHNGMKFSTYDNDNDVKENENCAEVYHGGWWYYSCLSTNPTGRYVQDETSTDPVNMIYKSWRNFSPLKTFIMMTRRK